MIPTHGDYKIAYPYISLIQLFSPGRCTEPSPVKFQACRERMLMLRLLLAHTEARHTAQSREQSREGYRTMKAH